MAIHPRRHCEERSNVAIQMISLNPNNPLSKISPPPCRGRAREGVETCTFHHFHLHPDLPPARGKEQLGSNELFGLNPDNPLGKLEGEKPFVVSLSNHERPFDSRVGRMSVALSAVCVVPCIFLIRRIMACGLTLPTALKISLCAFTLTAATSINAEELGRLFFTPQQRAMLERGQQPDADNPAGSIESLTVSGIVQKDGGERTVWINGVPQIAGKSDSLSPESVPVAVPGQAQPVKIKVGQKVQLSNPPQPKPVPQRTANTGDEDD